MPLCASTGPVLGRCCQHQTSTGPVLATNGMFTGFIYDGKIQTTAFESVGPFIDLFQYCTHCFVE